MKEELDNLNSRLDFERLKLDRINKIQDEINIMNDSLNNCIDIAYTSKIDSRTKSTYEQLKTEVLANNKRTNDDLDLVRDFTKININNIINQQDDIINQEKENRNKEKENEEEDNN